MFMGERDPLGDPTATPPGVPGGPQGTISKRRGIMQLYMAAFPYSTHACHAGTPREHVGTPGGGGGTVGTKWTPNGRRDLPIKRSCSAVRHVRHACAIPVDL